MGLIPIAFPRFAQSSRYVRVLPFNGYSPYFGRAHRIATTMTTVLNYTWQPQKTQDWVLALRHLPEIGTGSFAASTSSGGLFVYSQKPAQAPVLANASAHESSVNSIEVIGDNLLASAATDGVKVWDLRAGLSRAQFSFTNEKNSNFLSLGSAGHVLAGGTELVGQDAELHMWDLKLPGKPLRSFIDSHHDDITCIKFHPTLPYLMSGSTDGYVNIYNLEEQDEDEALHQVINYASVHLCHFVQPHRISVLSHMETLSFWELNNTNYEADEEPRPSDLGDVRALWPDCEYVIDLSPQGYLAYGCNLKLNMTVVPFDAKDERFLLDQAILFPQAHGEEVVRDFYMVPNTNVGVSCGEDGLIKAWQLPAALAALSGGESERRKKKDKKERKKDKKREKREKSRFKPY